MENRTFAVVENALRIAAEKVESALTEYLSERYVGDTVTAQAMAYSTLGGGKRIRAFLVLEFARMFGASEEAAMPFACALECIHAYSLIHDDLPCMDDDDLRRGRPTNHKVFGEGVAVLAGDALLTEAFAMLARVPANERYDAKDYITEFAFRTGSLNLVGGQVLDLEGEGRQLSVDELRAIHHGKTSALIIASLRLGGMAAGCTAEQLDALTAYGRDLGLAFQIIDDILDVTSSPEVLGKSIGKDAREQKATYPALVGLENARAEARALTAAARADLDVFSARRAENLLAISDYLLKRDY